MVSISLLFRLIVERTKKALSSLPKSDIQNSSLERGELAEWNTKLNILFEKVNRESYDTMPNHKISFTNVRVRRKTKNTTDVDDFNVRENIKSALRDEDKPFVRYVIYFPMIYLQILIQIFRCFKILAEITFLIFQSLIVPTNNMLVSLVLNGMVIMFSKCLWTNWSMKRKK